MTTSLQIYLGLEKKMVGDQEARRNLDLREQKFFGCRLVGGDGRIICQNFGLGLGAGGGPLLGKENTEIDVEGEHGERVRGISGL